MSIGLHSEPDERCKHGVLAYTVFDCIDCHKEHLIKMKNKENIEKERINLIHQTRIFIPSSEMSKEEKNKYRHHETFGGYYRITKNLEYNVFNRPR